MGAAIAYFVSCGYTVAVPLTDSQSYDLVVERGGVFCRVQCKTTTKVEDSGRFSIDLRSTGGARGQVRKIFNPTDFELLFGLSHTGLRWVVPANTIRGRTTVVLQDKFLV